LSTGLFSFTHLFGLWFALIPLFLSEIFSFIYPLTSFLFSIFSLTVTLFNVLRVERGKYSVPVNSSDNGTFYISMRRVGTIFYNL
jgi:hypothetical protein